MYVYFTTCTSFFYTTDRRIFARFLRKKHPKIFQFDMIMLRSALLPTALVFIAFIFGNCKQDKQGAAAQTDGPKVDTVALQEFRQNNWKNHGCDLITEAEIEKIFNFDAKALSLNSRSLPDQAFCLHTWNRPDWVEREANNEKGGNAFLPTRNSLVVQVFSYGTGVHSNQQFETLKRDRRDTYEESVTGVGEDALWGTTTVTLLVKKGEMVLSITLDAMDNPHDNLPKAKEIAQLALQKL
jgi:hypothetical protein